MTLFIVPVVEGQTEQGCVERLLHRVWHELLGQPERLQVVEPFRGHRDELVHPNGLVLTETVSRALVKLLSKSRKDSQGRPLILILLVVSDNVLNSAPTPVQLRAMLEEMVVGDLLGPAGGPDDELTDLGHGFHQTKQGRRYTISEPARREVLARLLKLNNERYAEEVRQGLHEK